MKLKEQAKRWSSGFTEKLHIKLHQHQLSFNLFRPNATSQLERQPEMTRGHSCITSQSNSQFKEIFTLHKRKQKLQ